MFTGIVEVVGSVTRIERRGELTSLEIEAPSVVERAVRSGKFRARSRSSISSS